MIRWLTILGIAVSLMISAPACGQGTVRAGAGEGQEGVTGIGWLTAPQDSLLAECVLTGLSPFKDEPVPALMVRAGKAMEGQPYVAGTLDERPEELRIYLTRTDCIIFVETCLALARAASQGGDFQSFAREIQQSRYRNGRVESYADRLHYTTEWARQGEKRGTLKDITLDLGGEVLDRPLSYMTSHPESYPLMDDIETIREAEMRINAEPRHYIPKADVSQALKGLRSGDIICMVTNVEGLDISHVGMALVDNGTVRLLHASTGPMKVVTESRTLTQYLAARPSVIGIQVLRPL